MAVWTLYEAREHLAAWLAADLALATGKEYRINNRTLTRANADEVKERIAYWKNQVAMLQETENGGKRVRRAYRVIPRDI